MSVLIDLNTEVMQLLVYSQSGVEGRFYTLFTQDASHTAFIWLLNVLLLSAAH